MTPSRHHRRSSSWHSKEASTGPVDVSGSCSDEANRRLPRLVKDSPYLTLDFAFGFVGFLTLCSTIGLTYAFAQDVGDSSTRNTVRLAMAWYVAALLLMIRMEPADRRAQTSRGKGARWCWTWGVLCFLVHVGMAFHYFHHWSHADAFTRTAAVGGVGEGIYASYLFTVLWTADAIAWWLCPTWHATRSVWLDRVLHGYLGFLAINGGIVFAHGPIRWAGILAVVVVAATWLIARRQPTRFTNTGRSTNNHSEV